MTNSKFLIGLGNPGSEYEGTPHNIGFALLDSLAACLPNAPIKQKIKKIKAEIWQNSSANTFLIYPQTYMNLSGEAVSALLNWYKITDLSQFLVIYDDISLPLGQIRWVQAGGAGGHHGIESIIKHLGGNKNFARLKFGIGPDPGGALRAKYVLQKFPKAKTNLYEQSQKVAIQSLQKYLAGTSIPDLMNQFNGLHKNNSG